MATPSMLESIQALWDSVYKDSMTHGIGIFRTGLIDQMMRYERVRPTEVFRMKLRPLPGKSHAHSRKIRREWSQRNGITVKINHAWMMEEPLPLESSFGRQVAAEFGRRLDELALQALVQDPLQFR